MAVGILKNGFAPTKDHTEGSVLREIVGYQDDETGMIMPFKSENGTEYYILNFEDGCRFVLTKGALNYLMLERITDRETGKSRINKDFLSEGIIPGMKFSAKRDQDGRPILKYA